MGDIKSLVVDAKWFTSLRSAVEQEVQRVAQRLADRVKQLDERYECTMPELEDTVEALTAKVEGHLRQMGQVWE
jgi:type I restriction enzyme M protein